MYLFLMFMMVVDWLVHCCRLLADVDGDGRLSRDEFAIAMHLTVLSRKGIPLPDKLPPSMLPRNAPSRTISPPASGRALGGLDNVGLPSLEPMTNDDSLINDPMRVMHDMAIRTGKNPQSFPVMTSPTNPTPAPFIATQKTGEQHPTSSLSLNRPPNQYSSMPMNPMNSMPPMNPMPPPMNSMSPPMNVGPMPTSAYPPNMSVPVAGGVPNPSMAAEFAARNQELESLRERASQDARTQEKMAMEYSAAVSQMENLTLEIERMKEHIAAYQRQQQNLQEKITLTRQQLEALEQQAREYQELVEQKKELVELERQNKEQLELQLMNKRAELDSHQQLVREKNMEIEGGNWNVDVHS